MVSCSAEPEPAFSSAPGVVIEVGGLAFLTGGADGTRSLIGQAVASAITVTKATARAGMTTRHFPRHRGASADAPGQELAANPLLPAVTTILWLFKTAECPGTKESPRGSTDDPSSPAPTSTPGFEMLVAGTFASWSRNLAAVGRSTGSLLRAVINTSIKYRLTPGIGTYSAQAVIRAGAKALATGNHPVADANGWPDGHRVPIDFVFANATRIADSTELPLTVDFEGAYSDDPHQGADNVVRLAATGAVGCNFEDQVIGGEGLHPLALRAKRIEAIRRAVGDQFSSTPVRPIPPGAVA
jgi:hypothetical protein